MSPVAETCIAPSTATSMSPPRIIPKLSAESKNAAPGFTVMVSLPALMSFGSSSPSNGYGPTPSTPFSECRITLRSEPM